MSAEGTLVTTDLPLLAACTLGGLVSGVFVNVLVDRVPAGRSLRPPWSRCACDEPMSLVEHLPLTGAFAGGGRCRGCGALRLGGQAVVEVANGLLWMLAAVRFGRSVALVPFLLLFSALLALSLIDFATFRLPDRLAFPVLYVSIPLLVLAALVEHEPVRILWAALTALGTFGFFALLHLLLPEGLGWGDVKLARLIGLYLGWLHPVLVVYALLVAGVLGLIAGGGASLRKRRRAPFAFGPWLSVGCVFSVLFSAQLVGRF